MTKEKIAYLGPKSTFTEIAARENFGEIGIYIPFESIPEVFKSVENEKCKYGVVPIENSNGGSVTETMDMLLVSPLVICKEIIIDIKQCLIAKNKNDKIRYIYSHPQAIMQCKNWIKKNYPSARIIHTNSTAAATLTVANKKENNSAAIASSIAAKEYKLEIIEENISDNKINKTRFIVVSKNNLSHSTGKDKTSIIFAVEHKPGALFNVLEVLKNFNINMTKIESRPNRENPWEYIFFIDVEGHKEDRDLSMALKDLEKRTLFLKILGSYPRAI